MRAWPGADGIWRALVDGRPVAIPPGKILERGAPDGGAHLCMSPQGVVYCFIKGQPKS